MIKDKRTALEHFMREQLIGPGGCSNKYGIYTEDKTICEVLNTTPGSVYSSAILFPIEGEHVENNEDDEYEDAVEADENSERQSSAVSESCTDQGNREDDEDINSISRRFPDKIGVSCCIKNLDLLCKTTKIKITGRYYTKILDKRSLYVNIEDVSFFENIFYKKEYNSLFSSFKYEDGKLSLSDTFSKKELQKFIEDLKDLDKAFCKILSINSNETIDEIYLKILEDYRYLSSYKERLYGILRTVDRDGNYLSNDKIKEYKLKIASIEQYQTFISYFEDLTSICDNGSLGFWSGHNFSKEIDLNSIDISFEDGQRKLYIRPEEAKTKDIVKIELSKDVYASLSVNLQLYKSEEGKIFLKVLLNNDSSKVVFEKNKYYSIVNESVNKRCFFGIKIDISSPYIIPYRENRNKVSEDQEATSLNYLYRNIEDYGIGHFCSVAWDKCENDVHVFSEFMPSMEMPDVEPIPRDKTQSVYDEKDNAFVPKPFLNENKSLQFKWLSVLSDAKDEEVKIGLLNFIESYKDWIDNLDAGNDEVGKGNVEKCLNDYNRIKQNINEFLSDKHKMLIFRLMNTAMFLQLWHSKSNNQEQVRNDKENLTFDYYKNKALDTTIFKGMSAAWRPFQLAFILLNLDGVFKSVNDPKWEKRNELVDLVWFPTGGGKTESYLGIIAIVIINRRLSYSNNRGNGTAAIMRYTLRLLTTQQFQRALRLILAVEQIRIWNKYGLGEEKISIGLYVGKDSLPNTFEELDNEINNSWNNNSGHGKIPLGKCPWCGSELRAAKGDDGHYHFDCSNRKCTYGKRNYLPVRMCDEDVYKAPPTFIIGTVDKFAQLAHVVSSTYSNKDSRRIFGQGVNCAPPDLIIQDEMHLLQGPLGSAVSLYECAIDQLCSFKDVNGVIIRPKIISSTATTRNTSLQVRALYDRDVSIFPKSGIDYDDSYFAFYKRSKQKEDDDWSFISKRKYVGILPTGRTMMTTQMRLASIIFVHRALYELQHIDKLESKDKAFIEAADYYYSTISYFNSLKEVGKTDAQFYMEFTKYTRRLFKRVLRFSNMLECFYGYSEMYSKSELTGRLTGSEAVYELEKAQSVKWDPDKRLPYLNNDNSYSYAELPADYILATNMISVGLDVSRFNTIIMNSMPRNIAEYIQASSRVARDKEGLVLTLHNPFRSRDVSHFERFREFHEKLYYYVEPISITPFSPKAVEKYLPLYMTVIIRHMFPQLADRKSAGNLTKNMANEFKTQLKQYFEERYKRTHSLNEIEHSIEREIITQDELEYIKTWIDDSIDQWLAMANKYGNTLVYYAAGNKSKDERPLLCSPDAYKEARANSKWVVPQSIRFVEPEAVLHVLNK